MDKKGESRDFNKWPEEAKGTKLFGFGSRPPLCICLLRNMVPSSSFIKFLQRLRLRLVRVAHKKRKNKQEKGNKNHLTKSNNNKN